MDIEPYNQTLKQVLAEENMIRINRDQSLSLYLSLFKTNELSNEFLRKIMAAGNLIAPHFQKNYETLTSNDILQITHMTAKFMLLNEVELSYFV